MDDPERALLIRLLLTDRPELALHLRTAPRRTLADELAVIARQGAVRVDSVRTLDDLRSPGRMLLVGDGGGVALLEPEQDGVWRIDVGSGAAERVGDAVLTPLLPGRRVRVVPQPAASGPGRRSPAVGVYERLMGAILGLAVPIAMLLVIDRVVGHGAVNTLLVLVLAVALLTAFQYLFLGVAALASASEVERQALPLRREVLAALLDCRSAPRWAASGWDLVQQSADLCRFAVETRVQALADALFVVLLVALMLAFSPLLTAVAAAFVPAYLAVGAWGSRLVAHHAEQAAGGRSELASRFLEAAGAANVIRGLNASADVAAAWDRLDGAVAGMRQRLALCQRLTALSVELLQKVSLVVIMLLGVSAVIAGALTLGQYIAFNLLSMQLGAPLLRLAGFWRAQADHALIERSRRELLDACAAEGFPAAPQTVALPARHDQPVRVEVRGLQALPVGPDAGGQTVDFAARGGEWVGVTGPSGCGKSTLLEVLAGLRDPVAGRVLVDGIEVGRIRADDRCRCVRLVTQQPVVLSGSLAFNIALGDPAATPAGIVTAAEVAGLSALAASLPGHLGCEVGPRGRPLSGGEALRLCIARAIVCRPRLLLLDEATAALDAATETALFSRLRLMLPHTLVVVVSHRPSSLARCDRVLTLPARLHSGAGTARAAGA
jgi:ATP-binding cassette, subfamily B, bacterial HlyB/CyaB